MGVRPWVKYTIIRLGIVAVVLAALLILQVNPFLATRIAVVVGFAVSYIFFRKLRDQVAVEFAKRNGKPGPIRNVDTDAEDHALDGLE